MDSFNKENFIYIKECSITKEFCDDIISLYNNSTDINDMMSAHCLKIKMKLLFELQNNMQLYTNRIIKNFTENKKQFDLKLFPFNSNPQKINLKIMKTTYQATTDINHPVFNQTKLTCGENSPMLHYVWFLNDYDGEICFWNYFTIKPKAGLLLISPTSWLFPYSELVHPDMLKYTLSGHL